MIRRSKIISKWNRQDRELKTTQLELEIERSKEFDRNFDRGGRSFYFFDFDDNVAILSTEIYVFNKHNKKPLGMSSQLFAQIHNDLGKPGEWHDYEINFDDQIGSFQNFRDQDFRILEKLLGKKQMFINDLHLALGLPDYNWKGPSWACFYHAVFNRRPISLITARGHHPFTLKKGIQLLVQKGFIPHEPNYLSLYPVNHPETRLELGQGEIQSVAELKRAAIRASVYKAIEEYGDNPYHRFGMSDDDPKNVELIINEMSQLKKEFPTVSFFIIETNNGNFIKREIFANYTRDQVIHRPFEQLALF